MYYDVVTQCVQSLKNLLTCLDKAEQYADAKKFDTSVLMTSRLAPDMQPLTYQVQSACDYVKAAAAWLSGQTPPRHEDNERTILPHRDGLRHPAPQRRRCRQAGFSRPDQSGQRLIDFGPFARSRRVNRAGRVPAQKNGVASARVSAAHVSVTRRKGRQLGVRLATFYPRSASSGDKSGRV
jgi:hypothetical protein